MSTNHTVKSTIAMATKRPVTNHHLVRTPIMSGVGMGMGVGAGVGVGVGIGAGVAVGVGVAAASLPIIVNKVKCDNNAVTVLACVSTVPCNACHSDPFQ